MGRLVARARSAPEAQVSEGQRAFDALVAKLEAVAERDRVMPNVDLQDAALATLAIAERVADPSLAERVEKQVKAGEFARDTIERAQQYAWAAVHIRRKLVLAADTRSEAKVSKSLADESAAVVERMRRVCDYNLDDLDGLAPVLAHLRLGTGYLDRANDLEEYAALYREHHAVVSKDSKHFRATDEVDALRLSAALYRALGVRADDAEHDWSALQSAAWPTLLELFTALRRIGVYLSGGDESAWPTLVTAARAMGRKSANPRPTEPSPTP